MTDFAVENYVADEYLSSDNGNGFKGNVLSVSDYIHFNNLVFYSDSDKPYYEIINLDVFEQILKNICWFQAFNGDYDWSYTIHTKFSSYLTLLNDLDSLVKYYFSDPIERIGSLCTMRYENTEMFEKNGYIYDSIDNMIRICANEDEIEFYQEANNRLYDWSLLQLKVLNSFMNFIDGYKETDYINFIPGKCVSFSKFSYTKISIDDAIRYVNLLSSLEIYLYKEHANIVTGDTFELIADIRKKLYGLFGEGFDRLESEDDEEDDEENEYEEDEELEKDIKDEEYYGC